jgi:hypothetical protein
LCEGFNNGYHSYARIYSFTTMKTFTARQIRALTVILLAVFVSVGNLLPKPLQDAVIQGFCILELMSCVVHASSWSTQSAIDLSTLATALEGPWTIAWAKYESYFRPKLHWMSHWSTQCPILGAPRHFSTELWIEAAGRLLKRCFRRTNGRDIDMQVFSRVSLLRFVQGGLRHLLGLPLSVANALTSDRKEEAYLRGFLSPLNEKRAYPARGDEHQFILHAQLSAGFVRWRDEQPVPPTAARAGSQAAPRVPLNHNFNRARVRPRKFVFLSRPQVCAVQVPVLPEQFAENCCEPTRLAVFSVLGDDGELPDLARAELLFSYDCRRLSDSHPNEPPPDEPLRDGDALDMVLIQWLRNTAPQPATALATTANTGPAGAIFQRVEMSKNYQVLPVACLARPRWAFPILGTFEMALDFVREPRASKWNGNKPLLVYKFL